MRRKAKIGIEVVVQSVRGVKVKKVASSLASRARAVLGPVAGLATLAVLAATVPGAAWAAGPRTLGFVVTDIAPLTGDGFPANCPKGRPLTPNEIFLKYAPVSAAEKARLAKVENLELLVAVSTHGKYGHDQCMEPETIGYDYEPHHSAEGSTVAPGFDLDAGRPAGNSCKHDEFFDAAGKKVIDNQLFRLMACTTYFNTDGFALFSNHALVDGGVNYVFEISGVTDGKNDPVEVKFYYSEDENLTDSGGNILPDVSIRVHDEPKAPVNVFRGKLVNGVLLAADGGEFNLPYAIEHIPHQMILRDVRLQLELKPDGTIDGMIGGYRDVENWFQFFRRVTSMAVSVYGLHCPGWIAEAHRLADGYPDPQTGKCTALSTANRLKAVPAFVIHKPKPAPTKQAAATTAKSR